MFQKVLIPTDLSDTSAKLITCAGRLPGVKEIVLLHVVRTGENLAQEREAVQRQQALITDPAIVIRSILVENAGEDIPAAILKTAEAERASLLIMGARKGLLSKTLLGHGGSEVLTQSQTHVLILRFPAQGLFAAHSRAPEPSLFARVLFPLDFSRPANKALGFIREMDGIREIILLHVIRTIDKEDRMNLVLREKEKLLADTRETIKAAHPDIRVKMMVRFGDPTSQIAAVADEEEATLVMMSRFGKKDYIRKVPLGTTTSKVTAQIKKPVLVMFTAIQLEVHARELAPSEFFLAEKIWFDYHQTKSDPEHDRIFAVFIEDTPVSVARCKRHDDGYEVDGIFTWKEFRGNGYARKALDLLIQECGKTTLFMYAVRHLVSFYASFGFVPVPEKDLPQTVRERYLWAMGDLEGAEVTPMKRDPSVRDTSAG